MPVKPATPGDYRRRPGLQPSRQVPATKQAEHRATGCRPALSEPHAPPGVMPPAERGGRTAQARHIPATRLNPILLASLIRDLPGSSAEAAQCKVLLLTALDLSLCLLRERARVPGRDVRSNFRSRALRTDKAPGTSPPSVGGSCCRSLVLLDSCRGAWEHSKARG